MNWLHMKKQTECLNSWDQVSPSTSNLLAKYVLNMLELTEKRKYGTSLNFLLFLISLVCAENICTLVVKRSPSASLNTLLLSKMGFVINFFRKVSVSESKHMEPSHLLRWGPCDSWHNRCYRRLARQGNKTFPLIHLILLIPELQSQSMLSVTVTFRFLQIPSQGLEKHSQSQLFLRVMFFCFVLY